MMESMIILVFAAPLRHLVWSTVWTILAPFIPINMDLCISHIPPNCIAEKLSSSNIPWVGICFWYFPGSKSLNVSTWIWTNKTTIVGANLRPGIPDFKAISKSLLASASNWERPERWLFCTKKQEGEIRQLRLDAWCRGVFLYVCFCLLFCPWTSTSNETWSYQKWLIRVELYYNLSLFAA